MQISGIIILFFYTFTSLNPDIKESGNDDDIKQLWHDCNLEEFVTIDVFSIAIKGSLQLEDLNNKKIVTFIAF
jgi:hypothetical protein